MTRRDLRDRLADVLAAAEDAAAFTAGMDEAAFDLLPVADRRTYRALKNALAEIGEAVKTLPPELLARHPAVNWRGWAGLRDVVSHQYFNLELPALRPAVTGELPGLIAAATLELGRRDAKE